MVRQEALNIMIGIFRFNVFLPWKQPRLGVARVAFACAGRLRSGHMGSYQKLVVVVDIGRRVPPWDTRRDRTTTH